jgi:hypothetical protein
VIAQLRLLRMPRSHRAYCELDRWSFDPRYTNGQCPVCGWAPPGAAIAPTWLLLARRVDWQLLGLFTLAILLIVVGLVVAQAAGWNLSAPHLLPQHLPSGIASGARTASGSR